MISLFFQHWALLLISAIIGAILTPFMLAGLGGDGVDAHALLLGVPGGLVLGCMIGCCIVLLIAMAP